MGQIHPAPVGWTEIESPPAIVAKYDPREPTLFEHGPDLIAVHVLPETQHVRRRDDRWRVGVVHGGGENFEGSEPIRTNLDDRPAALSLAESFMAGYREVREGGRTLTGLLTDCCEPAIRRRDG
ncbi:hypothetical protein BRC72_12270 [Halobacteriales archaeon QH_7_66_36]|nr:MAG: hypothetical protein BRC72_12270 [Halobacteriales archaeon QH_7_66_36]